MKNKVITPPGMPEPRGFSHAIKAGRTVYLAGHISEGGETMAEQFDGAATNLLTALKEAGGKPNDLVSLQVFVTDVPAYRECLKELAHIWRKHFGRHYPAMGLFGVTALLEPRTIVELMGIAVIQT